jgi:hypothetical protein
LRSTNPLGMRPLLAALQGARGPPFPWSHRGSIGPSTRDPRRHESVARVHARALDAGPATLAISRHRACASRRASMCWRSREFRRAVFFLRTHHSADSPKKQVPIAAYPAGMCMTRQCFLTQRPRIRRRVFATVRPPHRCPVAGDAKSGRRPNVCARQCPTAPGRCIPRGAAVRSPQAGLPRREDTRLRRVAAERFPRAAS